MVLGAPAPARRASLPLKYAKAARVGLSLPFYRLVPDKPRYSRWLKSELEAAGCLFVKIGQWVSSRGDIFPPDVTAAFSGLLRDVTPMADGQVLGILARDGLVLDQLDDAPISCGSIAQVHRGVFQGRPAAVKVQRPGLLEGLDEDLGLVRALLGLL